MNTPRTHAAIEAAHKEPGLGASFEAAADIAQKLERDLQKLHTAANRVAELYSAQYMRAHGDGGRVAHAMKQLNEALAPGW